MPPRKQAPQHSLITQAEYDRIVEIYRRHNGAHTSTAVELGWPVARTKRVFKNGWPKYGLKPIMEQLGMSPEQADEIRSRRHDLQKVLPPSEPIVGVAIEEVESKAIVINTREQARIRELMRREEDRRKAREDALNARAEEAMLISITRRNAIALNSATAQLMAGAVALSEKIQSDLEAEAAKTKGKLSVKDRLALVRSAASVARFNSETTMLAIKSERMVLGQPIESEPEHNDDGSLEQSVEWIERASRAVQRARSRGLLTSEVLKEEKH